MITSMAVSKEKNPELQGFSLFKMTGSIQKRRLASG
jgi:hypothetical protein